MDRKHPPNFCCWCCCFFVFIGDGGGGGDGRGVYSVACVATRVELCLLAIICSSHFSSAFYIYLFLSLVYSAFFSCCLLSGRRSSAIYNTSYILLPSGVRLGYPAPLIGPLNGACMSGNLFIFPSTHYQRPMITFEYLLLIEYRLAVPLL